MWKFILNRLKRDEKGEGLVEVLILMTLGSLVITPLMGYVSTGIKIGQIQEKRVYELYAADTGMENQDNG